MRKIICARRSAIATLAPIFVFVVTRGRDALAVSREAGFDRAGAVRLVPVYFDDVILDEGASRDFRLANRRADKI